MATAKAPDDGYELPQGLSELLDSHQVEAIKRLQLIVDDIKRHTECYKTIMAAELPTDERERLRQMCSTSLQLDKSLSQAHAYMDKLSKYVWGTPERVAKTTEDGLSATNTLVQEYAKLLCRSLCQDVYSKLPREIRNMVYSYIHPSQHIYINESYFESAQDQRFVLDKFFYRHVWSVEYVGKDVHAELCEHFYRSAIFVFHYHPCFSVPGFLAKDQWKLGKPPSSFVTNTILPFICGNVFEETDSKEDWTPIKYDRLEPGQGMTKHDVLAGLEVFFGFREGTKITIRLKKERAWIDDPWSDQESHRKNNPWSDQEWICDNVIPVILPTLHRYTKSGYSVRIEIIGYNLAGKDRVFELRENALSDSWRTAFEQFKNDDKEQWYLENPEAECVEGDMETEDGDGTGGE